ncbi:MAG: hypothetical protein IT427_07160 [Pirellulales bacterium]|nr:hypothetical protein [Pirellulales bacterium]
MKLQHQVAQAVRPAYEEFVAPLPYQERLSMDESPIQQGTHKAWLSTAIARDLRTAAATTRG